MCIYCSCRNAFAAILLCKKHVYIEACTVFDCFRSPSKEQTYTAVSSKAHLVWSHEEKVIKLIFLYDKVLHTCLAQDKRSLSVVLLMAGQTEGMSQKERMIAGRYYYAIKDQQLIEDRQACRRLCAEFNATEGGTPNAPAAAFS